MGWCSAPRHIGCRDRHIGWTQEQRKKNISLMTTNTRFLILPWAHIPNLASHLLGLNVEFQLYSPPQFQETRSAKVAKAVFGDDPLPGFLLVDRYAGYNKAPCAIQYCYAHLLRAVKNLEKEFSDSAEIKAFVGVIAPLLALAMNLRSQPISDDEFYAQARQVKSEIVAAVTRPAQHLGIRRIQDIFQENERRMYHWASDRRVPADNNLAERDLRPTVVARKVSFGSQSDAGTHTRGVLMTVLCTLKKRAVDVTAHLKGVLDRLAEDIHQDPFPLLFPIGHNAVKGSPRAQTASPGIYSSGSNTPTLYAINTAHIKQVAAHPP